MLQTYIGYSVFDLKNIDDDFFFLYSEYLIHHIIQKMKGFNVSRVNQSRSTAYSDTPLKLSVDSKAKKVVSLLIL